MLTSTLEVMQKHTFRPCKKYSIPLTQLFILIMQKDTGYAEKKLIHAQRRGKKKLILPSKKKDSSYLKKKIKDRVVQKECEFHSQKFHTHAHLDLIV
jgi:hypothetical protein